MHALDRKLLRDFRRLWAQALAIAMVLACGVAILMISFGMHRALVDTREAYYERNRFADVFASLRRAPLSLMSEISGIDGVMLAEARISANAILDVPGRSQTAVGQILSLPSTGTALLNVPIVRSGRLPNPDAHDEIVVNERFALANDLQAGDRIFANLNGTKRSLTIVGTVLSPEFIYTLGPGARMPDNEGFGIIWMAEPLAAAAFDLTGAFNFVSLKLSADANTEAVIDKLDALLDPYGGTGAYDRTRQQSNAFVDAEISQLRSMGYVLPPIFFGISAFLVNMVIGRIVMLERSEIGLLKAIGYSDVEICLHYLALAGLIAVAGIVIGWVAGNWLARGEAELYARFFDFPFLLFRASYSTYAVSGGLGLVSALIGATRSALQAASLAPAIAMAPPAPAHFTRTVVDQALAALDLPQTGKMIFRNITRWPGRSAATTLGMALAVAILMGAGFFRDALDEIVETEFTQSNRQDAMLVFSGDLREGVLQDVARLPGVLQVEGQMFLPVELRNGARVKHAAIQALRANPDLSRVVNTEGRTVNPENGGIVLSERLSGQLSAEPGDVIDVAVMTGRRENLKVEVARVVTQYFGLGAYMDLEDMNTLLRQSPRVSVANITLDQRFDDAFHAALKGVPNLASTTMMTQTRRSFQETIRQNVIIMTTIYIVVGVLITVGVAYNGARIQLSERARELASLRILGFSRAEVSLILIGETMVLTIFAQPIGWLIGWLIANLMVRSFSSDLYSVPLVLRSATYGMASLIVLAAALAATLVVRRRLDQLDLVAVLKTRE
jgi:putative ABC transport system permease protein